MVQGATEKLIARMLLDREVRDAENRRNIRIYATGRRGLMGLQLSSRGRATRQFKSGDNLSSFADCRFLEAALSLVKAL